MNGRIKLSKGVEENTQAPPAGGGGPGPVGQAELLLRLGVTPNYRGFALTLTALELLREDPEALVMVTKRLYPDVARRHRSSWRAVERNLRTAAALAWRHNPGLLRRMAGFPLEGRPTVSQFLSILLMAREG